MTIDTSGDATLIVAWRTPKHVHGRTIQFGSDFEDALRRSAEKSVQIIDTGAGKAYDPDDEQGESKYLTLNHEELQDTEVMKILRKGSSLSDANPTEVEKKNIAFYALLIGNDPRNRSIFMRARNPIRLSGKLVGILENSLKRVRSPVFQFDSYWDVVITSEKVWTFNQANFERLFKDTDVVLAKTDEWVSKLATFVPIADSDIESFSERIRSNSTLRRKVTSILAKQHLESMTPESLRERMLAHDLDPDRLMPNGSLSITKETQNEVLQFLNEDLFTGDFSGEQYAASRKARRS
ncbi:Kiwa anti-phage protein KwaB-like domain-containing protein [Streptomonospora salina]|uniref:DUF4868 domain-containing protein n=1 Tax=Streptomonospora salina TaxID=104205 RepID=A0A841ED52_9ACTN|nr:Kiwa anti-phage protein KwaB-like domain-containing protein [Streptomonospora salina]MBB6000324.1 hypothetical protein [Streptomonospora salina]